MDVPVYRITGFMDSGKTSLILETLDSNEFGDDSRTLIICCEEGEVEYDKEKLKKISAELVSVNKTEDLSTDFLDEQNKKYRPTQVFIEYNGTWEASLLLDAKLPDGWIIVQSLALVDASTYEMFLKNMRSMMTEQFFDSDVVIFNRCSEDTDKAGFRRTVKAINRRAQIVYEREDGSIDEDAACELPYDLEQDVIEITDADYGIFYLDIQENPRQYEGKTIRFLALVYRPEKFADKPLFVPGRYAMTCCVEDIEFIGLKCRYDKAPSIRHKSWQTVTATIRVEYAKEYRGKGPVLYATDVTPAKEPEDELVYFT